MKAVHKSADIFLVPVCINLGRETLGYSFVITDYKPHR